MKIKFLLFLCIACAFLPSLYAYSLTLTALSAGWDTVGYPGGSAQLWVDGVDYSQHRRGMNLIVIDQTTGIVLNSLYYDTYASSTDANNMATFINSIDNGRIVMVAVQDEAVSNMTSAGINALYTLGAGSFNPGYRGSWALIGIKGAAQGTQLQATVGRYGSAAVLTTSKEFVPEPSSWLISILGFGLFFLYRQGNR